MAGELISIGKAKLRVFGLTPQGLTRSSTTRVPGKATFKGMDYQRTGRGEKTSVISAITYPQVTGGMDMLGWLEAHHDAQAVVNMWRMMGNYQGRRVASVIIRGLDIEEDQPHPFTGVGRKVSVSMELLHVDDPVSQMAQSAWERLVNA